MPAKNILVIDNDADSLEMVSVLLSGSGYSVASTASPNQGLELYHHAKVIGRPFDLLIVDAAMPEMSGFNVAKAIRLADTETKIVMLTAFAFDKESEQRAREDGILQIWRKPEDADRLPELVAAMIGA